MKNTNLFLLSLLFLFSPMIVAQEHPSFKIIKYIKNTPVKSQGRTGTCWSFATISFLESEALRMKKPLMDLSEMYIVKNVYPEKAKKYLRLHGLSNFSQGGQAHDVLNAVRKHGLLTEQAYSGLKGNNKKHNHNSMEPMLEGIVDAAVESRKSKTPSNWEAVFNYTLDSYLGSTPETLFFNGKKYTPQDFSKNAVGINPDDYVELTSYSCYPYNVEVDLEIPDNWSHDLYYNVTIEDLIKVMDYALTNGYSVCWDGDTSEDQRH